MCFIDLEPCDLWIETEHKARTPKVCSSCRGSIRPGETYTKHFSKYDGLVTSNVMCKPCDDDRAKFAEAHENLQPTPDYFRVMLRECVTDAADDPWMPMLRAMDERAASRRTQSHL